MKLKEKYKIFLEGEKLEKIRKVAKENQLFMVIFIFTLALGLRLWKISSIPPGFSSNEAPVIDILRKMSWNNLWLGGQFARGGYLYIAFLWTKVFGLKVIALRVLSAIIGSLTVLFSYVFISKWFSKKNCYFYRFFVCNFFFSYHNLSLDCS